MAVWLIRAGDHFQFEDRFFKDDRVYLTCDGISGEDFTEISDYSGIRKVLLTRLEGRDDVEIVNLSDVVFEFVMSMTTRDFVITPRKTSNTVAIGEILSPYGFDPEAEPPFNHLRDVKWIAMDVPTPSFTAEVQSYLNVTAPVVQIKVSNVAAQVRKIVEPQFEIRLEPQISASTSVKEKPMQVAGITSATNDVSLTKPPVREEVSPPVSGLEKAVSDITGVATPDDCVLESLGLQAITQVIGEDFARHGAQDVVRAILEAGGFTITSHAMECDDSLFTVAPGTFGLDRPITGVRVHPTEAVSDAISISEFYNAVQANQCEQGLLVSWCGFDRQAVHDANALGTRVRLWDREDIVKHFLAHYASLNMHIQQRIPLKRIWVPSSLI